MNMNTIDKKLQLRKNNKIYVVNVNTISLTVHYFHIQQNTNRMQSFLMKFCISGMI